MGSTFDSMILVSWSHALSKRKGEQSWKTETRNRRQRRNRRQQKQRQDSRTKKDLSVEDLLLSAGHKEGVASVASGGQ